MKRRFNQSFGEGVDTATRWSLRVALGVIYLLQTVVGMQLEGAAHAIARPGYQFNFPRDYGSHPDFKIEWWYVTGHLKSEGDRRFGYQATFFRLAADSAISSEGNPPLPQDIHLAHMALLDLKTKKFYHQVLRYRQCGAISNFRFSAPCLPLWRRPSMGFVAGVPDDRISLF